MTPSNSTNDFESRGVWSFARNCHYDAFEPEFRVTDVDVSKGRRIFRLTAIDVDVCVSESVGCGPQEDEMKKADEILQSMTKRLTGKRISGGLITLSSAAIFAVYAAGYEQTKAAADRFEQQSAQRFASFPIPVIAEETAVSPGLDSAGSNRALSTDPAAVHAAVAVPVHSAAVVPTYTDSAPGDSKV